MAFPICYELGLKEYMPYIVRPGRQPEIHFLCLRSFLFLFKWRVV